MWLRDRAMLGLRDTSVLIVDDEATMRRILTNQLKSLGVTTFFEAETLSGAIRSFIGNRPNFVVLDITMSRIKSSDSLKALAVLCRKYGTYVIAVVSRSDEEVIRRALSVGAKDVIVKPFTFGKLAEVFERAIMDSSEEKEKKRVLVVDDERIILSLWEQVISSWGFAVECADRTKAAREILKEETVDLIVSDISIPEEDGITFIANIRQQPEFKSIPVVFVSGFLSEDHTKRISEISGVAGVITKPPDMQRLRALVEEVTKGEKDEM